MEEKIAYLSRVEKDARQSNFNSGPYEGTLYILEDKHIWPVPLVFKYSSELPLSQEYLGELIYPIPLVNPSDLEEVTQEFRRSSPIILSYKGDDKLKFRYFSNEGDEGRFLTSREIGRLEQEIHKWYLDSFSKDIDQIYYYASRKAKRVKTGARRRAG